MPKVNGSLSSNKPALTKKLPDGVASKPSGILKQEEISESRNAYCASLLAAIEQTNASKSKAGLATFIALLEPVAKIHATDAADDQSLALFCATIKSNCGALVSDAASATLIAYEQFMRHERMLIGCQKRLMQYLEKNPKHPATTAALVQCQKLLAVHTTVRAKFSTDGLANYHQWLKDNAKLLSSFIEGKHPAGKATSMTGDVELLPLNHRDIGVLCTKAVANSKNQHKWENLYDKSLSHVYKIDELIENYLDYFTKNTSSAMATKTSLGELKEVLQIINDSCNKTSVDLKQRIKRHNKTIQVDPQKEFAEFVEQWFKKHPKILQDQTSETVKATVKTTVERKCTKSWGLTAEAINSVYIAIFGIADRKLRNQFYIEFSKRFTISRLKQVTKCEVAKKVAAACKAAAKLEEIHKPAITDLIAKCIPKPLNWYDLKLCLDKFSCKTEVQLELKQLLLKFINDNDTIALEHSVEARQSIEYLISCLYQAYARQQDEGILFNNSQPFQLSSLPRGMHLVMAAVDQKKDKRLQALKTKLENIAESVDKKRLLFTRSPANIALEKSDKKSDLDDLTPSKILQAYLLVQNKITHNHTLKGVESKFNDIYQASILLTRAATLDSSMAQEKLLAPQRKQLAYDYSRSLVDEYTGRLKRFSQNSHCYHDAQWNLYTAHLARLNTHSYETYEARLQDLLQMFEYYNEGIPAAPYNEKNIKLDGKHKLKHAFATLISEILGGNPLYDKLFGLTKPTMVPNYPFRVLPASMLTELLRKYLVPGKESNAVIADTLNTYRKFLSDNIQQIKCTRQANGYSITIAADDLAVTDSKTICFIDPDTLTEIGRFYCEKGQIHFKAYGDNIKLNIEGQVQTQHFVLENPDADIHLQANFKVDSLYIGGRVQHLTLASDVTAEETLHCEIDGKVTIPPKYVVQTKQIKLRASELVLNGIIHADNTAELAIDKALTMHAQGRCKGKSGLLITAGALKDIRGKLRSDETVRIQVKDSIYLHGESLITGKSGLQIEAKSMLATDKATVITEGNAKLQIKDSLTFDRTSGCQAQNIAISASTLKNSSPNLNFDRADLQVTDEFVNYANGILKTNEFLRISGGSVWNDGEIDYGKELTAKLNKFFVNGVADQTSLLSSEKHNRKSFRPLIKGGNAQIIAGIFVNVFSRLQTHRLTRNAIVDIDLLSLTSHTGMTKSNLVNIDLGMDVPNIGAVARDIYRAVELGLDGEYGKLLDSVLTMDTLSKTSTFARFVIRTLCPAIGKPVDLAWSILLTIASSPQIFDQLKKLYNKHQMDETIHRHEWILLLTSLNSLATQGLYIESQIQTLANGIGEIDLNATTLSTNLMLSTAALFLPTSTSNSVFKFQSGLHAGFNTTDRSVFANTFGDVNIAFNATQMFYASDQKYDMRIANNVSAIGHQLTHDGEIIANSVSVNVVEQNESGSTTANTVTYQADHLQIAQTNNLHAHNVAIIGQDASVNGAITSDSLLMRESHSVAVGSNMEADTIEITAGSDVTLTTTATLHESSHATTSQLHISGDTVEAHAASINMQHAAVTLSGRQVDLHSNVTARTLMADAKEDLTVSGMNTASTAQLTAGHNETVAGSIRVTGSGYTDTPPALTMHASNITTQLGAEVSAANNTLAMVATNDLHQSGSATADIVYASAGHDFDNSGEISATNMFASAERDCTNDGHISADSAYLNADNAMTSSGVITVTNPTTATDHTTQIALSMHGGSVSATGSITGAHSAVEISGSRNVMLAGRQEVDVMVATAGADLTVNANTTAHEEQLSAGANVTLAGHNQADDVRIHAGQNIQDSAVSHMAYEELSAGDNVEMSGHAAIDVLRVTADHTITDAAAIDLNGAGTNRVAELDADTVNMTATSQASGDGSLAINAHTGSLGKIDVANLSVKFDHVPDVEDLLLAQGIYRDVHAQKSIYVTTQDPFSIDRDLNFANSVGVNASYISVNHNIHSDHSLSLATSAGSIDVSKVRVTANDYLDFDAAGSFNGQMSNLYGGELYIKAGGNIVNYAGNWIGGNYLGIQAGGGVYNDCYEYNVAGKYDTLRGYQPGTLVGGAGINHDGVGCSIQANGMFVNDASTVMSIGSNMISANGGIVCTPHYHEYISYYRNYHNWVGRRSVTVDTSYQLQSSLIYSEAGSNTLLSSNGSIVSTSTNFLAAGNEYFSAKGDIKFLGLVLTEKEYKERGNLWGLDDHKIHQTDEYAVPTVVINPGNITIVSETGRVALENALLQAQGTVTLRGVDVDISAPILNHYYTSESRGFTFSTPIQSLLSSPLTADIHVLKQASGAAETTAATLNTLIDTINLGNNALSFLNRPGSLGSMASSLLSAQIGYYHERTSVRTQSVAPNVGVYAGNLDIQASNRVTMSNAVPVNVANNASIHARVFTQTGARLESSMQTSRQSAAVGVSISGDPTFSASLSGGTQRSTENVNQHLTAGGRLEVVAEEWNMRNANVTANVVDATVARLNIVSDVGSSSSHSWSASASTTGSFGVHNATSRSAMINEESGIVAESDIEITGRQLNMAGSEIISKGTGHVAFNEINAQSVKESNVSNSIGFDGSVGHSSSSEAIPTDTVSFGHNNYQATEESTIFIKSGTDLGNAQVNGPLNTTNRNGLSVQADTHINLELKVPTSTQGLSMFQQNLETFKDKYLGPSTDYVPGTGMRLAPPEEAPEPAEREEKADSNMSANHAHSMHDTVDNADDQFTTTADDSKAPADEAKPAAQHATQSKSDDTQTAATSKGDALPSSMATGNGSDSSPSLSLPSLYNNSSTLFSNNNSSGLQKRYFTPITVTPDDDNNDTANSVNDVDLNIGSVTNHSHYPADDIDLPDADMAAGGHEYIGDLEHDLPPLYDDDTISILDESNLNLNFNGLHGLNPASQHTRTTDLLADNVDDAASSAYFRHNLFQGSTDLAASMDCEEKDPFSKGLIHGLGASEIGLRLLRTSFVKSEYGILGGDITDWKGINGKWYDIKWGGNQYAGARANIIAVGEGLEFVGKALDKAAVVLEGINMFDSVMKGDQPKAAKEAVDTFMGIVAFTGPLGFFASMAYNGVNLVVEQTGGWEHARKVVAKNTEYAHDSLRYGM
jgi:hypothetical protein